jgi:hypothetical protein
MISSRYPSLFVIARNSCFTFKDRAVDVKQVGRELGVRYVLEGSLRKSGNRIRVTAQLVEAETGNHVWAERYDRDLADIFAVQDEITLAVTIAIAPALADAEQQRAMRKPPASLDAWAAFQRGLWHFGKANAEDNALAQKFFQQAIDLDPNFAGDYAGLADARGFAATVYQTRALLEEQRSNEMLTRRAVALDGADAEARSILFWRLMERGDYEGAFDRGRSGIGDDAEPGRRTRSARRDADLRWPTKGRTRLSRNLHQTRSSKPMVLDSFEPGGVGPLFLPRLRGCGGSGKANDPFVSGLYACVSLARGSARTTWSDRGGKGSLRKGNRRSAGPVRHACPQSRPLDATGRLRAHG